MSYIDLIIIAIFIYNAFQGLRRGLILIVVDLLAIIGSIFIGLKFHPPLSTIIMPAIDVSEKAALVVSFCLIWGLSFMVIIGMGKALDTVFSATILGPFNRIGGACVGLFRGGMMIVLCLIPLFMMNIKEIEDSVIINKIAPSIMEVLDAYLPPDVVKK